MGSDCSSLPHFFSMLPVPTEEMKLSYNNKTQTSQRLFTHIKSAEGQSISLKAAVLHVLEELHSILFLWILLKLYTLCSVFSWGDNKMTPFPSFCFSTFFYLTAPPRQHVLPQTLRQWKRKHGEWWNSSSMPSRGSSGCPFVTESRLGAYKTNTHKR